MYSAKLYDRLIDEKDQRIVELEAEIAKLKEEVGHERKRKLELAESSGKEVEKLQERIAWLEQFAKDCGGCPNCGEELELCFCEDPDFDMEDDEEDD